MNEASVRAVLRLLAVAAFVAALWCGALVFPVLLRTGLSGLHAPRRYATYVPDYGGYRDLLCAGLGALLLGLVLFASSRRLARAVAGAR